MAKKKRKRKSIGKYILLIGAIVFLNLIGVSYGYWNDGLQLITSITTGRLDVRFARNPSVSIELPDVHLTPVVSWDGDRITIEGEVPSEHVNQWVTLNYSVENTGTIPVRLGGQIIQPQSSGYFNQTISLQELLQNSSEYSIQRSFNSPLELNVRQFNDD
ncbi:hypothetical protein [Natronincola ferrireducens]|uniref:Uncharacterized protein n=1 Tax=Natronincola ferrireducens TaxID=393762 RepID=A0A1G8XX63_9FIRM|nr:hypothetical protein [Natronincola ferrireducens]SDJ94485.1 hypothetical protein SAMN05660472_00340 [Natronincola ferrireducens]